MFEGFMDFFQNIMDTLNNGTTEDLLVMGFLGFIILSTLGLMISSFVDTGSKTNSKVKDREGSRDTDDTDNEISKRAKEKVEHDKRVTEKLRAQQQESKKIEREAEAKAKREEAKEAEEQRLADLKAKEEVTPEQEPVPDSTKAEDSGFNFDCGEFDSQRAKDEFDMEADEIAEFLEELAAQIDEELPIMLDCMKNKDYEELKSCVHKVKGSAVNLGENGIAKNLYDFNHYLSEGGVDEDEINKYYADTKYYVVELRKKTQ